jgi:hypothetical protein
MATFLRILRLYALALWVGGLVFFILVAYIAFTYLPTPHLAGIVVRHSLIDIHCIGIAAAALYILATFALIALRRDAHPVRAAEITLAVIMLGLTLYSQLSIIPRMDSDRLALGGDIQQASQSAPAAQDFNRLHMRSVHVESAILFAGLVLLILAPIRSRPRGERIT